MAPAFAWEGQVKACYDKIYVAPTYTTSKTLIKAAKTKWEHRHGQMVEVHYPAIYREHRHLKTPGHYIARPAKCKKH